MKNQFEIQLNNHEGVTVARLEVDSSQPDLLAVQILDNSIQIDELKKHLKSGLTINLQQANQDDLTLDVLVKLKHGRPKKLTREIVEKAFAVYQTNTITLEDLSKSIGCTRKTLSESFKTIAKEKKDNVHN